MELSPKAQEALENYVQDCAAQGRDPHEARKTAERALGLVLQLAAPRPPLVHPSAYGTLIPTSRSR